MIKIVAAQIYSTKGEMAYQIEYSDGTIVRAVESANSIIRSEHKTGTGWVSGKAYVVKHSKKRNAELIKESAIQFLAGDDNA